MGETFEGKTGDQVVNAFKDVFKEGDKPLSLQTDDGKEFYNKKVQTFLKTNGVHHFSTKGDTKASTIERFNRTLKDRLYRYFTAKNTLSYKEALPLVVEGYNASLHKSIGMAPEEVTIENSAEV